MSPSQCRFLNLLDCYKVKSLAPLSSCRDLLTLYVQTDQELKNLSPLADCTKLVYLAINGFVEYNLKSAQPTSLSRLSKYCPSLRHLLLCVSDCDDFDNYYGLNIFDLASLSGVLLQVPFLGGVRTEMLPLD